MGNGLLQNANSFTRLLFCIVIIIASFLFSLLLATLLAIPIYRITGTELLIVLEDINAAGDMRIMKYFQIWLSIGTFVLPSLLIAFFFSGKSLSYLSIRRRPHALSFFAVILLMLAAIPLINILAKWNSEMDLPDLISGIEDTMKRLEEKAMELTNIFLSAATLQQFMVNLLMIAVIPALGEEFLFRGVFQRLFTDWTGNIHAGVLLGALLFSFFHLQFYGFLPRLLMGVLFGYLLVWSKSIWLPVLAHFTNNSLAVIVYHFYGKEIVEKDIDTLGTGSEGFLFFLLSLLFVAGLSWLIIRTEQDSLNPISSAGDNG